MLQTEESTWMSSGTSPVKVCFCTHVPTTEPDGMSAPEVVPVNSSTVRVLWFPPLQPNGAVTGYYIYVNDRVHGSVDNSSGSYLLGDLRPFTIYNVQVHKQKKADLVH